MIAVLQSRVAPVLELESFSSTRVLTGERPESSLALLAAVLQYRGDLWDPDLSPPKHLAAGAGGALWSGGGPWGSGMSRRWRLAHGYLSRDHGSDGGAGRGAHEPGYPARTRGLPRRAERRTATQVDGHHRLPGR